MTSPSPGGRRWNTAIVWFRRDLRIHDHPALVDAISNAERVVPLFVFDPALLDGRWRSSNRAWFLAGCVRDLDQQLRSIGGRLVVRAGDPAAVVPAVAREAAADAVLVSRDTGPYGRRRDRAVAAALATDGRTFHARRGSLLAEPEAVTTAQGGHYTVFSPFWRALGTVERRQVLGPPAALGMPGIEPGELPPVVEPSAELPAPGEAAARARLEHWVADGLEAYHERRNELSGAGTSRLSADLHFGAISVTEADDRAARHPGPGSDAWRRQLGWREFYHHLLWHRPGLARDSFRPSLGSAFRPASADPDAVEAWRTGQTGIPVVDAAMRQLRATGWISNRGRLVVASFLTRQLLIDHRVGEDHFMAHLVDGDLANDNGGWQWSAGVGTDAQPWFRIFDPVRQGVRFDADGSYVRRWVPELAGLPDAHLHAPWLAPGGPPAGYPPPIVDLRWARERALAAFKAASTGA
jgi:deoxyribodipyrimidine photo-lyase